MEVLFIILKGIFIVSGTYAVYAWIKSKKKKSSEPKTVKYEGAVKIGQQRNSIETPSGHPTKPPGLADGTIDPNTTL